MTRYRITTTDAEAVEQTWTLLPDEPSARMQAGELARREKTLHVRIYREATGEAQALVADFPAKQ